MVALINKLKQFIYFDKRNAEKKKIHILFFEMYQLNT